MDCESTVNKAVCVEAKVTLTPDVDVGVVRSHCFQEPHVIRCSGPVDDECTFLVSQLVCVQIPLTFTATATAQATGIVCNVPCPDRCEPEPPDCDPDPPDCDPDPPPYGYDTSEEAGRKRTAAFRRRDYAAPVEQDESGRIYYRYPRKY